VVATIGTSDLQHSHWCSTVQYRHACDTELVRVGHGTVSKKIIVYIEFDIYMQGEETTERELLKCSSAGVQK
jgi:hypothetical protein